MFTLIVNSNQEGVKLNYIDGVYSHLNGVYINNVPDETNTQEKQDAAAKALEFKTDVLWSQLDALWSAYVEPARIPPGAWAPGTGLLLRQQAS